MTQNELRSRRRAGSAVIIASALIGFIAPPLISNWQGDFNFATYFYLAIAVVGPVFCLGWWILLSCPDSQYTPDSDDSELRDRIEEAIRVLNHTKMDLQTMRENVVKRLDKVLPNLDKETRKDQTEEFTRLVEDVKSMEKSMRARLVGIEASLRALSDVPSTQTAAKGAET